MSAQRSRYIGLAAVILAVIVVVIFVPDWRRDRGSGLPNGRDGGYTASGNSLDKAPEEDDRAVEHEPSPISRDEALRIAREAVEGTYEYDHDGEIVVALDGGQYIITFPVDLPEGSLGPDYAARVTIDARSGEIIQLLVGS